MAEDDISTRLCVCRKCGAQKPATTGFFHKSKDSKIGLKSVCIPCARERTRDYMRADYAAEPEKRRKRARNYRSANPEKIREINRANYARDREKRLEYAKAYRAEHLDECRAKSREISKRHYAENKGIYVEYARARRARKAGAEGSYSQADIDRIRAAQKDRCAYCCVKLKGRGHVDHIVALSKGGSNWPRNLQMLCEPCNLSKSTKDPINFAQSHGLLV